jgi:ABC-type molybdate transport system substrate-binding protein
VTEEQHFRRRRQRRIDRRDNFGGLKLGMGDEKQCALGFLTKDALDTQKICEAVQKNIAVRSPTGDFLVNQMRTGSLDAVVVYESNATFVKDVLDVIPIKLEQKFATQPVAVGKTTRYKYLTQRLIEAFRSPKSAERFKANGFQWLADQK